MKRQLVIIDPQNSFCKVVPADQQQIEHNGELCVPGAWQDMERLADLVLKNGDIFENVWVTLDSHHQMHVSHPFWYKDSNGKMPSPFTLLREENGEIIGYVFESGSKKDLGVYTCATPSIQKRVVEYLRALEATNRYPHCIWPAHCLIGTPGHNVVEPLMNSLLEWEIRNRAAVDFVTKGSSYWVEHFSAVKAEVPDPYDVSTQVDPKFIQALTDVDELVISGEAGSHCVANTIRDIANEAGNDDFVKKCVLLIDATSPVPGFESYQSSFIDEMTNRGMRIAKCSDYI